MTGRVDGDRSRWNLARRALRVDLYLCRMTMLKQYRTTRSDGLDGTDQYLSCYITWSASPFRKHYDSNMFRFKAVRGFVLQQLVCSWSQPCSQSITKLSLTGNDQCSVTRSSAVVQAGTNDWAPLNPVLANEDTVEPSGHWPLHCVPNYKRL